MYTKESVIILKWIELPSLIRDIVKDIHSFRNDVFLEYCSEFKPSADETWNDTLVIENFQSYYKDQCENNNYQKSFEEFITDYGLTIDWWLKDQPFDFTDIKRILFEVNW